MRAMLTVFAMLAAVPAAAVAQGSSMPEGYRDVLVRKFNLERNLLLAMADSMPERLYRDKATPVQRDFAQQLHHCVIAYAYFGPGSMNRPGPELPDTAAALNGRAAMRELISRTYDWAVATLRDQSLNELNETVEFFGAEIPRWQVWDELHLHTIWTAGQVVANFRKHGMAPPGFAFF